MSEQKKLQLEESWALRLKDEFDKPYMQELRSFLVEEKSKHWVYPPSSLIFNAFNTVAFDEVKVVVLGQDPYHGPGQAHGLSFSVPDGIKQPPSLKNILKEVHSDIGTSISNSGNLLPWANQGVLLLNASLTVRRATPGSHQKMGWLTFTNSIIELLSSEREHLVFLLWGNFARAKKDLIDEDRHYILEAAHPSPFSAYQGFFGCKHFSKTNQYLEEHGLGPIDWSL